jgi:hypothetical protein
MDMDEVRKAGRVVKDWDFEMTLITDHINVYFVLGGVF